MNNGKILCKKIADGVKTIELPNQCPQCHQGIVPHDKDCNTIIIREPKSVSHYTITNIAQFVFSCPSCERLFIANYKWRHDSAECIFVCSEPTKTVPPIIREEIRKLSGDFCEIYSQALEADQRKLNRIAGMGLRKALDFLIRDYCKSIFPEENHPDIDDKFLWPCIDRYIQSPVIKEIAQRATWLGNDETHVIRKWPEKDINDLKKLLNITQNSIADEICAKRITKEMPPR